VTVRRITVALLGCWGDQQRRVYNVAIFRSIELACLTIVAKHPTTQ